MSRSKSAKSAKRTGGNREKGITRMSRMPLRGLGWLGDGRDVYIEKHENRFADRNALGERMGGDNLDNPGPLFQGAPPERAASGSVGILPAGNMDGEREGRKNRRFSAQESFAK